MANYEQARSAAYLQGSIDRREPSNQRSTMRRLILLAALVAAAAAPAHADERGREVKAVMEAYIGLWNAHDAAAVTSHIYRFDAPNPMSDEAGLAAEFARLKSQGYDHSVISGIEACVIGPDQAMAELRYSRLRADGTPLPPKDRATLYLLRHFPDGWRITRLIPLSATAKVSCKSAVD
jgi:ketosteroid isomerase-like protein